MQNFLNELGILGQWLVWLIQHPAVVLIVILGLFIVVKVWGMAVSWVSIGKGWFAAFFWTVVVFFVLLFAFGLLVRYIPAIGQWYVDQAKTGLETVTVPNPPGVSDPVTPTPVPAYNTPVPTQSGSSSITFGQPGTYVVNYSTGTATLREECASTATSRGELPNGTVVTVTSFVASNCVEGVCQRAIIAPLAGYPSGGCLHAVTLKLP